MSEKDGKLNRDIHELKKQLRYAQEDKERAYLRGLKEGYNKGSAAGVQMVADHMALQVNPPYMVMGGTVPQFQMQMPGQTQLVVKAPIGDTYEWVTAEEASARLFAQMKTIMGHFKIIEELQGKLDKIYDPYNYGPSTVGFGPVGGTVRTVQKPVSEKCGVKGCNRPVRSDHSEFCQQCWDVRYPNVPQERQWDTGDPWD